MPSIRGGESRRLGGQRDNPLEACKGAAATARRRANEVTVKHVHVAANRNLSFSSDQRDPGRVCPAPDVFVWP